MLEVRALGRLEALYDNTPLHFPTEKVPELLCFLLLQEGRQIPRTVAAEALWPMRPPGRARRSLSTALWRLRQAIRQADSTAPNYIIARRQTLAFDASHPYRFDVAEFQQTAIAGMKGRLPCRDGRLTQLCAGVDLYEGPLLSGAYNDWCLAERERLQLLYMQCLKRLLHHHRLDGSTDAAEETAQRLLAIDPLQEDVHRELMRCFVSVGQRARALEQYERCWRALRAELRIEPAEETRMLYQRIRTNEDAVRQELGVRDVRGQYEAALDRLQDALEEVEESWSSMQGTRDESLRAASPQPPFHS